MRLSSYIVINRSSENNLVVAIVDAYSMTDAVNRREGVLRRRGHRCEIIAVTESLPGPYGTGGRVLRAVESVPPVPPVPTHRVRDDVKLKNL